MRLSFCSSVKPICFDPAHRDASESLLHESLLHAFQWEPPPCFRSWINFFANRIHFFAAFGAFSPGGVSFSPGGVSYSSVSTFATLLQSYFISAHRAHRFVSAVKLLFCYAVLKRIRSLMLMCCRNHPAVVKYSATLQVDSIQSKQSPCTFNFPCKTIDF